MSWSGSMRVRILPGCQRKVMGLVVHSDRHHADEPEGPDTVRIAACNRQDSSARNFLCLHRPALDAIHGRCVGRDHRADRGDDGSVVRHRLEAGAALDISRGNVGTQRNVVHVDQMLTQRFDVDAAPVRLRVRHQLLDDLLDCSEGRLPSLQDTFRNGISVHPMVRMGHTRDMLPVRRRSMLGMHILSLCEAG